MISGSPPVPLAMSLSKPLSKGCYTANTVSMAFESDFGSGFSATSEAVDPNEEVTTFRTCDKNGSIRSYRLKLEEEVHGLEQQLHEEIELHAILKNVVENSGGTLTSSSSLPHDAQQLLSNIATLEVNVSKLENEMVSLHYQLIQERNERRLAEYSLKESRYQLLDLSSSNNMSSTLSSSSGDLKHSVSKELHTSEEVSCQEQTSSACRTNSTISSLCSAIETTKADALLEDRYASETLVHLAELGKHNKNISIKGLWRHPNHLSEEMVRCMKNIFIALANSSIASSKSSLSESPRFHESPHSHLSNSSIWSLSEQSAIGLWMHSPQVDLKYGSGMLASENVFDPYRVLGKLSWADIGDYSSAIEVSWMSVGQEQLEFAAGALRKFRLLVEQLAKVNPTYLRSDEKLAFWINLHNALVMHAYLAYGVPRSDLKLFSLMQKAAYTVGGHSISAATIEYAILKMKPPLYRPQIALLLALHKIKMSEQQRKFAIDAFEPLVTFALSCGMYSSPAVRIYTAEKVREELQEAQHDFVRASVGVSSKGKLLVPKMLHCFAKGFVDDANLAVWISHFLPPQQAAFVEQCILQRRQSFLASRSCGILPFDSRFRYLFFPENLT